MKTAFGVGMTHYLIALYHLASVAVPSIATEPFVELPMAHQTGGRRIGRRFNAQRRVGQWGCGV